MWISSYFIVNTNSIFTACIVIILASYSRGLGLKSRRRGRISWLRLFIVFLSPSRCQNIYPKNMTQQLPSSSFPIIIHDLHNLDKWKIVVKKTKNQSVNHESNWDITVQISFCWTTTCTMATRQNNEGECWINDHDDARDKEIGHRSDWWCSLQLSVEQKQTQTLLPLQCVCSE